MTNLDSQCCNCDLNNWTVTWKNFSGTPEMAVCPITVLALTAHNGLRQNCGISSRAFQTPEPQLWLERLFRTEPAVGFVTVTEWYS